MNYGANMKLQPVRFSGNDLHVRIVPPECIPLIEQLAEKYMEAFNAGMPVKLPQQIAEEVCEAIALKATQVR